MAKFCPNCGNEMVDEAEMCVKCGTIVGGKTNKKVTSDNNTKSTNENGGKKKELPTWAIVLIVLGGIGLLIVIVIAIFAIIGINALKKVDPDKIKDKIDDYIEENTSSTYGTINDTLSDGEFKFTLTGAYTYDSIGEGYIIDTPEDGKEYLLFFLDVENISDEDEYISYYDFKGYADDVSCDNVSLFNDVNGVKDLSADLASGKKAQGFVAFEVPKDWQTFELHYKKIFGDKSLVFKVVSPNEGA